MRFSPTFALLFSFACAANAQMNEVDQSLRDALESNPDFIADLPKGHVIRSFERTGGITAGPLIWGPNPNDLEVRVVAIGSETSANCDVTQTQQYPGGLTKTYTQKNTLTTTVGSRFSQSLNVDVDLPGVGSFGTSMEAEISTETGKAKETGDALEYTHSYIALVDPRKYIVAQLQVFEQKIEGQPFEVDIKIADAALVTHAPGVQWLPKSAASAAALVIAGTEKDSNGNRRELAICRAELEETTHPGKVVDRRCNFGYGGDEKLASRYEVLSLPKGSYRWVNRDDFEEDNPASSVTNGDTTGVIAGKEERVDRYDGQLLVCRAEHKGSYHPGKLVDSECMFGYGGKEIEKKKYQVLVLKELNETTTNIRLSQYLPKEMLSFRLKGTFEGTRALSSTIVLSQQLPVTEELCPAVIGEVDPANTEPVALPREVNITSKPVVADDGEYASAASDRSATGDETSPEEPLIEGTSLSSVELEPGVKPLDWNIQTLRLTRPFMRGTDVLVVQKALTAAGWPVLEDGVYGGYTTRAVMLFQRAHGLEVDGVIGPDTERRLGL